MVNHNGLLRFGTVEAQYQISCLGVCIINFEHIRHFFLVFLLLTLNKYMLAG